MMDKVKKYILNLVKGDLPESVTSILAELDYVIEASYSPDFDYEFTLIDHVDAIGSKEGRFILFGETDDRESFFEMGGVAVISSELLQSEIERTFFKRLLGDSATLQVNSGLTEELRSLGKVKVTDHLNSGFYCDSISVKAAEEGFDFFNIKKGLFHLFNYVSEVIQKEKGSFPLDVDFGICGDTFFLQAHFPVEKFYSELVWKALSKEEGSLSGMGKEATSLDIYTLKSSSKLVITSAWTKDVSSSKSIYIHGIDKFKAVRPSLEGEKPNKVKINYKEDLHLELGKDKGKSISLSSISRIVNFLEMKEIDVEEITLDSLAGVLRDYPNQNLISKLDLDSKEEILNLLLNSQKHNEIKESLEIKKTSSNQKEILEKFLKKVESLNIDEANEIVSLGVQDYTEAIERVSGWVDEADETTTVIKGAREDIGETSQLIKGSKEEEDNEKVIINGSQEDLGQNKDILEVKSLKVNEEAERDFSNVKGELPKWRSTRDSLVADIKRKISSDEIKGHEDLSVQVSTMLRERMNISEGESSALVQGLLNDSVLETVSDEKREVPSFDSTEFEKLKEASAKKDIQLSRMMKLIDVMKKELLVSSSKNNKVDDVRHDVEISRLNTELERKNKQIEILKTNTENIVTNNETEKRTNEAIDHVLHKGLASAEAKGYESKIKTLETMLEEAKERSETLNTKLEDEKRNSTSKADADTTHFREKMMKSQVIINKLQKENKELGAEVENLKKVQAELSEVVVPSRNLESDQNLVVEKEREIEKLVLEIKKGSDQNKAIGLKIKQLEQKNKFLTAQVEESSSKNGSGRSSTQSSDSAKFQHKIKQLEKLNNNFKAESDKAKAELAEKKKEILKYKQEANLLKSKVTEFERKLAINKKKAA
ncbi:hypothetical protein [Halobacteriovorax sp. JY17]|uniref:hypothetical protein n=1 Tax=Halobacteriovorax sp. JY17 TaxID=2014617 RepID=UPI000C64B7E3|nr:hypothetical protein [Halobacteriovorax sp. JY17]PIK13906.1 MAG: hypothetical protein CES88_13050 [Halobacteriovorax sp. JY17]